MPHSVQAEQSVIGGVMLKNDTFDGVAEILSADDFFRADHRLIFGAISECAKRGEPMDVVTVSSVLESSQALEDVGGLSYLATIAKETPSAANITAYAQIVKENSTKRKLVQIGEQIAALTIKPGSESAEIIQIAERLIAEIAQTQKTGNGWTPYKTILSAAIDKIEAVHQLDGKLSGISTGFPDLDEMTLGLQRSDLIILAGRPSMGKTSLGMQIAEHIGVREQLPVAIFSMEMAGEQLGMRSISSFGRINSKAMRIGKLEDEEWPRMTSAINILAESKLFVDDSPALTPSDLRARCRRLTQEQGQLGLILVDYLQLMRVPGLERDPVHETTVISKSLKALAKEFDCPVLALSQLNRSLEQRPNKRPIMADLRQSGAIEQDADVIMFVYRDEVYNKDSTDKGTAEIIFGKQRNGQIGTVKMVFLGPYTRFEGGIGNPT